MKSNTLWPFQALTIYVWSFSAFEWHLHQKMSFTYSVARTRHLRGLARGKLEPFSRRNWKRTPDFCSSWLKRYIVRHKVEFDLTRTSHRHAEFSYHCENTSFMQLYRIRHTRASVCVCTSLSQHFSLCPQMLKWTLQYAKHVPSRWEPLAFMLRSITCWRWQWRHELTIVTWSTDYRRGFVW
jgi:hypothetical protein